MNNGKRYWFPAKRVGWGWGPPSTWQGWVVLVTFLVLLAAAAWQLLPMSPGRFALVAAITTAVLIAICYITGEPPGWRSGDDN